MTDITANLCACMGAMHGEPYCHCEMERRGIPRSAAHDKSQAEFTAFVQGGGLDEIFNKRRAAASIGAKGDANA